MIAPPAEVCTPLLSVVMPLIRSGHADTLRQLSREAAARVVAWVNAQPPPTEFEYRTVIVVTMKDRRAIVLMGDGAEICRAIAVSEEVEPTLMRLIDGGRV